VVYRDIIARVHFIVTDTDRVILKLSRGADAMEFIKLHLSASVSLWKSKISGYLRKYWKKERRESETHGIFCEMHSR